MPSKADQDRYLIDYQLAVRQVQHLGCLEPQLPQLVSHQHDDMCRSETAHSVLSVG